MADHSCFSASRSSLKRSALTVRHGSAVFHLESTDDAVELSNKMKICPASDFEPTRVNPTYLSHTANEVSLAAMNAVSALQYAAMHKGILEAKRRGVGINGKAMFLLVCSVY